MSDDRYGVKHSETKSAWNIVGTEIGGKYKIARIPYIADDRFPEICSSNRKAAFDTAMYLTDCLNKRGIPV